jgi:hypothetical protein
MRLNRIFTEIFPMICVTDFTLIDYLATELRKVRDQAKIKEQTILDCSPCERGLIVPVVYAVRIIKIFY